MSYSAVDPVIRAWTERHGFTLFEHVGGKDGYPVRCVYVSSPRGECFQIWVEEPEARHVSIHAADVETHQDVEFRQDWRVPATQLGEALERVLARV